MYEIVEAVSNLLIKPFSVMNNSSIVWLNPCRFFIVPNGSFLIANSVKAYA